MAGGPAFLRAYCPSCKSAILTSKCTAGISFRASILIRHSACHPALPPTSGRSSVRRDRCVDFHGERAQGYASCFHASGAEISRPPCPGAAQPDPAPHWTRAIRFAAGSGSRPAARRPRSAEPQRLRIQIGVDIRTGPWPSQWTPIRANRSARCLMDKIGERGGDRRATPGFRTDGKLPVSISLRAGQIVHIPKIGARRLRKSRHRRANRKLACKKPLAARCEPLERSLKLKA